MSRHKSLERLLYAAGKLPNPIKGPAALARALGVAPAVVTNWGGRASGVSHAGAAKAQRILGINSNWTLDGVEPMFVGDPAPEVSDSATGAGYVRAVDMGMEGGMGGGRINDDFPEIIRAVDYTQQYIRSLIGFVPPPGRLVLVTGHGDSMMPTIQPGESLLVDTGVKTYDGDGVYLVNLGNGQQVKRLIDHGIEKGVHVHSDNPVYPALPFPDGGVIAGKVYLRNRVDRFN